jgi:release factor glutamine methyltransferase
MLYGSTGILITFLDRMKLQDAQLLELGAGSGLISIYAALRGGQVVASDINPVALRSVRENAEFHGVNIQTIESNLFSSIPHQHFDYIIINPPYFPREAMNMAEMALFCGSDFEYFRDLFSQLANYPIRYTKVLMILSERCEIKTIDELAHKSNLKLTEVFQRRFRGENSFIYSIELNHHAGQESA